MVEAGFLLVVTALLVMAFTTILGVWLVEKTLKGEGEEVSSEEQPPGQQPH